MQSVISALLFGLVILLFSFSEKNTGKNVNENVVVTTNAIEEKSLLKDSENYVATTTQPSEFVEYAKKLMGTPYLYGSADPDKGLDCSGFINAVSNHFGIKVPRSSAEFTNLGRDINTINAKPGDLILFTGTDPGKHVVGHIGIITDNVNGQVQFIHSSSGKTKGVTVSSLDGYYETRLVKVIRIFPTAENKIVV